LQSTTTQAHLTQPQANTVLSQTNALIQSVRTTNTTLQMGLISGGVVQYRNYEQSFKENAPSDLLNPAVGPHMDLNFRHSLLQGYGVKLNDRGIRIAKLNTGGSLESFRSQLLDLVANVLNGYWDLVSAGDEFRARQRSQENTQKFYEDTQKEIAAGAIPRVELSRAAAEVATRRQDLVVRGQPPIARSALRDAGADTGSGGGSGGDPAAGPHRDSRNRRSAGVAATGGDGDGEAAGCGGFEVA
jgi:hypothetical protein